MRRTLPSLIVLAASLAMVAPAQAEMKTLFSRVVRLGEYKAGGSDCFGTALKIVPLSDTTDRIFYVERHFYIRTGDCLPGRGMSYDVSRSRPVTTIVVGPGDREGDYSLRCQEGFQPTSLVGAGLPGYACVPVRDNAVFCQLPTGGLVRGAIDLPPFCPRGGPNPEYSPHQSG
jgi:hypothetical protein